MISIFLVNRTNEACIVRNKYIKCYFVDKIWNISDICSDYQILVLESWQESYNQL